MGEMVSQILAVETSLQQVDPGRIIRLDSESNCLDPLGNTELVVSLLPVEVRRVMTPTRPVDKSDPWIIELLPESPDGNGLVEVEIGSVFQGQTLADLP